MLIESLHRNLLTKRLVYGILYTVDEGHARGCAAHPPPTYERGLFAMSIVYTEVLFFYTDAVWGEMSTRVRAAFHTAEAAEAWAFDRDARLAQAASEWDEDFGPTPSLRWETAEIRFSEVPLY